MPKKTSYIRLAIVGVLTILAGIALLVRDVTVVLDAAEIERLEAGGTSVATMGDFVLLLASPVLTMVGAGLVYLAWSRSRKSVQAPGHEVPHAAGEAMRRH